MTDKISIFEFQIALEIVIKQLLFVILQVIYDTHAWYYTSKDMGNQIGGFFKEYENIVFVTVKVSALKSYLIIAIFNHCKYTVAQKGTNLLPYVNHSSSPWLKKVLNYCHI